MLIPDLINSRREVQAPLLRMDTSIGFAHLQDGEQSSEQCCILPPVFKQGRKRGNNKNEHHFLCPFSHASDLSSVIGFMSTLNINEHNKAWISPYCHP